MSLVVDKHVSVAMRDGTVLAADVYRTEGAEPCSTVLIRTPYSKDDPTHVNTWINVLRAAESGWAVVVQDVRGRFRSGGTFVPFAHEADDGADTIAWVREQPWSDGYVGMVGGSYVGITQWLAATRAPEGLLGIVPACTADDVTTGWMYEEQNLTFGFLAHWASVLVASSTNLSPEARARAATLVQDVTDNRYRTFDDLVEAAGDLAPYLPDWRDRSGKIAGPEAAGRVRVPALVIAGWFDIFGPGAVASYPRREAAGTRHPHDRLLAGPWAHGLTGGWFPGRTYGPAASFDALDPTRLQLGWFETLRDGGPVAADPVTVFVMGADEWRSFSAWPPQEARLVEVPLRVDGSRHALVSAEPVPTIGGRTFFPGYKVAANAGPRPQGPLGERDDVVALVSDPLPEDTDVLGGITCRLAVASDAPTMVVVKLSTADHDGDMVLLAEGSSRTANAGQGETISVDLGPTAMRLPRGTRLSLTVAASDFPRLEDGPRAGLSVLEQAPVLHLDVV
ncbi:hydrolase CocE/NonD family protein [Actinobacteria bacterium OK006]|nr:hydrolase CocE/NonD family protein [Actinobacteria bacterium OK006]